MTAMELLPVILAHVVESRAAVTPDFPVLTFDHPDRVEPVTYAGLFQGAQAVARTLEEALRS